MAAVAVGNLVGSAGFGLGLWGLPDFGYAGVAWSTFGSALLGLACNLYAVVRKGILNRAALAPWSWVRRALPAQRCVDKGVVDIPHARAYDRKGDLRNAGSVRALRVDAVRGINQFHDKASL